MPKISRLGVGYCHIDITAGYSTLNPFVSLENIALF